ncbi:O-antigen ligase family protein [Cellulophaga omnivescoria]|uniref:O-antigen ligase family protein n=1 Tax=Cellulophaga omnivescoria TaxID=1888890 RepID=UPI001559F1F3|nr:O-antigen ligase family protein [Cellulophaga omnivescoria]WBU90700.1 O-antigen ligase family protein [Cellulophaga omnivescoria]
MNAQNHLLRFMKGLFIKTENNVQINLFWNFILLGFVTLPFGIQPSSFLFILSMFFGVSSIFMIKKTYSLDIINWSFPLLFFLMTISLYYSYDVKEGLKLIERSLPLIIFPIIFMFIRANKEIIDKVSKAFIFGIFITFIFNLIKAFYSSLTINEEGVNFNSAIKAGLNIEESIIDGGNYFFGGYFSTFMHPSYVGLYVLVGIIYTLKSSLSRKIKLFLLITLSVYIFFLSSKSALVLLLLIGVIFLIYYKNSSRIIIFSTVAFLGILVFINPRINQGIKRLNDFNLKENHKYTTSSQSRILSWKVALDLIEKSPFLGYGVGDADKELLIGYLKSDYITNAENEYNAHNQFLQTTLQVGVLGLILFLLPFAVIGYRVSNIYNLSMLIVLIISLVFESMLVRYNGIIFYSIVVPILLNKLDVTCNSKNI